MKLLRTLLADLRDRQILPAVGLLVLLAFAVPIGASILLGKVTTLPTVPVAPNAFRIPRGTPSTTTELVILNGKPPTSTKRNGNEPNPFSEATASSGTSSSTGGASSTTPTTPAPPVSHTTTTVTVTKTAVATTTTTATRTNAVTHTTTATHTATAPPKTTTTTSTTSSQTSGSGTPLIGPATLAPNQAYAVTVDTKDAKGAHVLSDLVRLAPLPAAQSPEVVFLGVLRGGKKAVFLFANPIKLSGVTGETCLPDADACQIIELSPGQGMKLAPASNTALIATFTFEVGSIGAKSYSSAADALAARNATSSSGATLLPLIGSTELSAFHFDSALGSLTHHSSSSTGATGAGGSNAIVGSGAQAGAYARRQPALVLTPAR